MGFIGMMDPLYWVMIIPTMILAGWAQMKVKSNFSRFSKYTTARRLSGADTAEAVLNYAGVRGVKIEETRGFLSDHYDPRKRVLRLSPDVFRGQSIAAAGVAAHEAGHAIQHAKGYAPLALRNAMVPLASFGSWLAMPMIIFGMFLQSMQLMQFGVLAFAALVVFQMITLPVEWGAFQPGRSRRRRQGAQCSRHDLCGGHDRSRGPVALFRHARGTARRRRRLSVLSSANILEPPVA